jgi:hypothetical protein
MMRAVQIRLLAGAMARVPDDATAYAYRDRKVMVNVAVPYERPEEADVYAAWVADLAAKLQRGPVGAYVGFLRYDEADRATRERELDASICDGEPG